MRVVIVGAGIACLVTALRLHREDIACTVLDQSLRLRELGVGLNLLPHAVRALAELDLLDRLDAVAVRTRELIYLHRLGQEILRRKCGADAGHDVPQLSVHRGRLQGVLLLAVVERLGHDAVRTGRRLVAFDQDARGVRARFVDRRTGRSEMIAGDVLVAADGIHSTVRSLLFPAEGPPHWNGVLMWRGAADWPTFATGRTMLVAGGTAAKLVIYPIAEGTQAGQSLTNWAVCLRTGHVGDPLPQRQDWSRPADRDRVERRAPDGFAAVSDVIDPAELDAMVDGYARASSASG